MTILVLQNKNEITYGNSRDSHENSWDREFSLSSAVNAESKVQKYAVRYYTGQMINGLGGHQPNKKVPQDVYSAVTHKTSVRLFSLSVEILQICKPPLRAFVIFRSGEIN